MIAILLLSPDHLQRRIMRLLNFVHVLFLAVFLLMIGLSAGRASASENVCEGKNLLGSLVSDHPDLMAEIHEKADATANGKGIMWRIERHGTPPSFLYGTMHSTDPRVNAMDAPARMAYRDADTVVIEATDAVLDQNKLAAVLFSNPELTMLPAGQTLAQLLDGDQQKTLNDVLDARNVPLSSVQRMRPWLVMTMLSLPECELARTSSGIEFLDKRLATEALDAGKELAGLETALEQFEAMNGIPLDRQADILVESATMYPLLTDLFETMTALYLEGEIAMIMPTLGAFGKLNGLEDEKSGELFQQVLIDSRNSRMAERAVAILERGNAFVAVGALHLPGDNGLVELLRKAGYTVTPVD